jgi:hypothetical protein
MAAPFMNARERTAAGPPLVRLPAPAMGPAPSGRHRERVPGPLPVRRLPCMPVQLRPPQSRKGTDAVPGLATARRTRSASPVTRNAPRGAQIPVRHERTVRRPALSHQPRNRYRRDSAHTPEEFDPRTRMSCSPWDGCGCGARPAAGIATNVRRPIDVCRATGISAGPATTIAPRGPTFVAPPAYKPAALRASRFEPTRVALPEAAAHRPRHRRPARSYLHGTDCR